MEKLGWYEFKAEGLSLEKLLNQCGEKGIKLQGVRKTSARAITGQVLVSDAEKLQELAQSRGWRLTVGKAHGLIVLGKFARARIVLAVGILVFIGLVWAALSCIWFIDIQGAGPYSGEVERILLEHDVRVGRFSFRIDEDALRQDMESQLTGIAWVGVSTNGVRLTIRCVQADRVETIPTGQADVVAQKDGVISSITVTAGTPQVKVGDVVRRGQVLVRGEERSWNGAVNPVRAKASVEARVWYTAEAVVSGYYLEAVPNGEKYERRVLCMPFYEYAFEDLPDFKDFDMELEILPIGGSMPIWLRVERYQAVTRVPVPREATEVCEEAGIAAMRLAQEKLGNASRVVDKWVEYSMINDGGCRATAVLEAIEEIAAAPEDD